MIKFIALKHKASDTYIPYETFIHAYKMNNEFRFTKRLCPAEPHPIDLIKKQEIEIFTFKAKDMLFSDEFEVI